jgi:hypothetical protein
MKTHIANPPYPARRRFNRNAQRFFNVACLLLIFGSGLARAIPIALDSGVSGTFIGDQSYNETRAVDVTVLSPVDLLVQSMTLSGIGGSGNAEAVIYNSANGSLVADANGIVNGGTLTVAISTILIPGAEYRIGFFGHLGEGTFFLPGNLPYTESSGLLQINGAYDSGNNNFPTFGNMAEPQVVLQVAQAPERGSLATLGIAGLALLGLRLLCVDRPAWGRATTRRTPKQ